MDKYLLTELETESWRNGSRGHQKETRASYLEPLPLYTKLLGGVSNVSLDVDTKIVNSQTKYLVKVQLEEPPIETADAQEALEDGFQNLASYSDDDGGGGGGSSSYGYGYGYGNNSMISQDIVLYGKTECIPPDDYKKEQTYRNHKDSIPNIGVNDFEID
eukprot:CAMPEP_0174825724 /NCGR_PEP_ID=MMETSP1107-20130205/43045_1 /TAXON_ID=36770 /ORGANISM="Paraphysomonas vestita, Strain GFlagA" /LENGTH=159 /DNA_ID=CAMNT_0016057619 /DNA_START=483 /DNA_END=959 /DNA_ORIENTATION=+